ncbi:MAG: hypothetical protein N3B17_01270 [Chlorobi bacterium]|nr:hypothetical protein [Chlorobiota bacterium]
MTAAENIRRSFAAVLLACVAGFLLASAWHSHEIVSRDTPAIVSADAQHCSLCHLTLDSPATDHCSDWQLLPIVRLVQRFDGDPAITTPNFQLYSPRSPPVEA